MDKFSTSTFVKWASGKTQLLNQLSDLLPEKIERYFEPMVGSGAVFFYAQTFQKIIYIKLN